jgi:hypothetical protein
MIMRHYFTLIGIDIKFRKYQVIREDVGKSELVGMLSGEATVEMLQKIGHRMAARPSKSTSKHTPRVESSLEQTSTHRVHSITNHNSPEGEATHVFIHR